MIKILFISDLDSTIIYSGNPNDICVEYQGTEEITYMTYEAHTKFTELLTKIDFKFIPCTLRSFEQTSRISFINNASVPLIICDNGFSIYNNGVLNKTWDKFMHEKIKIYPNIETYNKLQKFTKSHNSICRIKDNRGAFFTIIFNSAQVANLYSQYVLKLIDCKKYKFELQGRKIYILPNFLDKALAVNHINHLYSSSKIITAGDSHVDDLFIKYGDIQLIPKHSKLINSKALITENSQIKAGEDIIKFVYSTYLKS